jgi:hypothetical protein
MEQLHMAMVETLGLEKVTLNVRRSNESALNLYQKCLGYELTKTDLAYYADKEDAFYMTKKLEGLGYPKDEPVIDLEKIISQLESSSSQKLNN